MLARLGSTIATLAALIGFATNSTADGGKPKKSELEGTWTAVKKDAGPQQLKFVGNKFEATIGGKVFKGTFKLSADENPSWIDLKITESEEEKFKGKTAMGIYEFEGANLRWCSSRPGSKRRPPQFATQMGDARLLLATFELKK